MPLPKAMGYALALLTATVTCTPEAGPQQRPETRTEARPPDGSAPVKAAASGADAEDIALARQKQRHKLFTWQEFSPEAFARARSEGRLLLLDCVAVWCHWCHVMDETTYEDEEVGALLQKHFVTMRVDVDARPDIAERYQEWGWPATVLFDPSGEELGKFRGYLEPKELRAALQEALSTYTARTAAAAAPTKKRSGGLLPLSAPLSALGFVGNQVAFDLDRYYDEEIGGWGGPKKMAGGADLEFELLKAAHGDAAALERARLTLEKQRALYDPVWGGVYQYSTGDVWTQPHFEKLMPIQTANIEGLVRAYAVTHEPRYLEDALKIAGYLREFLQDHDGAFLVSQDADLGGFEGKGAFVDGHKYYALDAAQRRQLGVPRIDANVYPYENGLAIAALTTLSRVTAVQSQTAEILKRARQAADLMLLRFVDPDGTVWRQRVPRDAPRFLSDAASLGRGLSLLGARTGDARYVQTAERIAAAMLRTFAVAPAELSADDPADARFLLWGQTRDPAAVGVFARRAQPFEYNVLAARFLASLLAAKPSPDGARKLRAQNLLSALATPAALSSQGRMLGEYLLALDEVGALRWR